MAWMETLLIQTNIHQQTVVSEQLQGLVHDLPNRERASGLFSAEAFCHSAIAGGHLLLLRWESADMPREGSGLGLHIKEIMNQYGLVEHTIWRLLK